MKAVLNYYGSKQLLAPWVARYLPRHTCYVEPYGGSAAVLLHLLPPAPVEVFNDLDAELVTVFRVLRERPQALAAAVQWTPYARSETALAYQPVPAEHPERELEVTRRFLIRAWQTRGGPSTAVRSGWRYHRYPARSYTPDKWARVPERILAVAQRLKHVQIEHDAALTVIRRYDSPDTCFYLDPPYLAATRAPQWRTTGYRHEMTADDHQALATLLHTVQGMAVISGYACPLYATLYAGWQQICRPARGDQQECLWLSPTAQQRAAQLWLPLAPDASSSRATGLTGENLK